MPQVQRHELTAPVPPPEKGKKAPAPKVLGWAETHTKLSGGQVRSIIRLYNNHVGGVPAAERDEIGWQHEVMVLLTEAWSFEDPDKPGEKLPKSMDGIEKVSQEELNALWAILDPLVSSAFPNV